MHYAAILLGLAGSLHCAGMCSPLAMAVARAQPFARTKIVYNSGRVLIYALLGAVAAATGSLLGLGNYQPILSVVLGVSLVLIAIGWWKSFRVPGLSFALEKFTSQIKKQFSRFLSRRHYPAVFLLGALNGLLPCGLSLMAITYTFILPSARDGFLFMLLFGLGTWPVMIGLAALLERIFMRWTTLRTRFTLGILLLSGVLLISRGLWPGQTHQATKPASASMPICLP